MHADTSDFFIEDCRPGGATGWQYRRGDRWFDFQHRAGSDSPQGRRADRCCDVYENEQGILSRTPDAAEGPGKYLSVAWIGEQADGGRAISTWLDVIGVAERGRRDGSGARLAASVARVAVCRSRGAHRHASQRLAAAARRRQLGHHAGAGLGSGESLARPRASRSAAARVRSARSASSPAPTKSCTAATDRRCTPTLSPTIASGGSSNG